MKHKWTIRCATFPGRPAKQPDAYLPNKGGVCFLLLHLRGFAALSFPRLIFSKVESPVGLKSGERPDDTVNFLPLCSILQSRIEYVVAAEFPVKSKSFRSRY